MNNPKKKIIKGPVRHKGMVVQPRKKNVRRHMTAPPRPVPSPDEAANEEWRRKVADHPHGKYNTPPTAVAFDQAHAGEPIIVMGNSSSLNQMDLKSYEGFTIVGCNRGLRDARLFPDYLIVNDREPYIQERDEGRLQAAARRGTKLLLGRTMFDPTIRCIRLGGRDRPELPVQKTPDDFSYATIDVCCQCTHNFETFRKPMASFANVAGPMIQSALILGARLIGFIGIDMEWPKKGPSHHYGEGSKVGAYKFARVTHTMDMFMQAKMKNPGVKMFNLSPVLNTPFSKVFGNKTLKEFLKACSG